MRAFSPILLITLFAFAGAAPAADTESSFRAVLKKHCVMCHGPDTQEGEVRLDTLPLTNLDAGQVKVWKTALKLVASGEMPPKEELRLPRTTAAAIQRFLQPMIAREAARLSPDEVVLRRLNKEQYRNSLRDLLGIDVTVEDPAAGLPPDEVASGFDNIGSALTMSPLHVKAYFEAAEQAVAGWEARAAAVPNSFRFKVPFRPGGQETDPLQCRCPQRWLFRLV